MLLISKCWGILNQPKKEGVLSVGNRPGALVAIRAVEKHKILFKKQTQNKIYQLSVYQKRKQGTHNQKSGRQQDRLHLHIKVHGKADAKEVRVGEHLAGNA